MGSYGVVPWPEGVFFGVHRPGGCLRTRPAALVLLGARAEQNSRRIASASPEHGDLRAWPASTNARFRVLERAERYSMALSGCTLD
jgi:hypothetical protein